MTTGKDQFKALISYAINGDNETLYQSLMENFSDRRIKIGNFLESDIDDVVISSGNFSFRKRNSSYDKSYLVNEFKKNKHLILRFKENFKSESEWSCILPRASPQ